MPKNTYMRFFEDDELEDFYGKPIETISPTDDPLKKYISGQETIHCEWCNAELKTHCADPRTYEEVAYCDKCHLKHTRNRAIISNNTDYDLKTHRTDEREEYVCPDCKERHPFTEPKQPFSALENPQINSYEMITLPCYCGNIISLDNAEIPYITYCENCSRKLSITLQTHT